MISAPLTQQHEEPGNPELIAIIRDRIFAQGPITYAEYMELALYHPVHGYYLSPTRRPGRGGDFITSPELHPFFGLTLARQIVECWDRLGRPNPFTIREYGSGIGGLAYDILAGVLAERPEMRPTLRYLLNEVNPHRTRQAIAATTEVGLDDVVVPDRESLEPITGVVLANEVADALPVHRLVRLAGNWCEVRVGWDEERASFVDVEGDLSAPVIELEIDRYLAEHDLPVQTWLDGARIEVSPAVASWTSSLAAGLERGYAFIIDYGYPVKELFRDHRLEGTVRAYQAHTVTDNPYLSPGEADLTAHVDFTRVIESAERAGMTMMRLLPQGEVLANLGLGERLVELQSEPEIGIEEYYRAQAAVFRLIDPAGLGRFRVLGLARNAPIDPPLAAFALSGLPEALRLP